MSANDEIANRHLLVSEGIERSSSDRTSTVRIVVGEAWASARAGQLLTSCLVNLLVRQLKLIAKVEISSPPKPSLIQVPGPAVSAQFPDCLGMLGKWAVNGLIDVTTTSTSAHVDHTVLVGLPPAYGANGSGNVIVAIGDAWRAWVGFPENAPGDVIPASSSPLGPFLAAALAAGEIFKRAHTIRRGAYLSHHGFSLWSGRSSSNWHELDPGPEVSGRSVPPVHVPGSGAVGNALAYLFANLELLNGYLVIIDDDLYDTTNLNRCLLAGWSDLGDPKVQAVARAFDGSTVGVYPFEGRVRDYVVDSRKYLRSDVAKDVDNLYFDIVASCVDRGASRQDVQGLRPRLLLGGSTLNLVARTNIYGMRPGAACLGCYNPAERDAGALLSLVGQLRSMSAEDRAEFLADRGLDPKSVETYLSGAACGSIGETALRDFATRPPPQFSVGFVSLGAGLLLTAALLRHTVFATSAPVRNDMTSLTFLGGKLLDAGLSADPSCELNCQGHAV